MFITTLFTVARTWKQPRCPLAGESCGTYTQWNIIQLLKRIESVLMRWTNLEPIIQSEVSQKEKHQYSILTHIYGI